MSDDLKTQEEILSELLDALYGLSPLAWAQLPGREDDNYVQGRDVVVQDLIDSGVLTQKSKVFPDGSISTQLSPTGRREYQEKMSTSNSEIHQQMEQEIRLGNEFAIAVYNSEMSKGLQVRVSCPAKRDDLDHYPRLWGVKFLISQGLLAHETSIGGHGDIENAHLTSDGRRYVAALLARQ